MRRGRDRIDGAELPTDGSSPTSEGLDADMAACWLRENGHCLESSNVYVETHGLPLGAYRLF